MKWISIEDKLPQCYNSLYLVLADEGDSGGISIQQYADKSLSADKSDPPSNWYTRGDEGLYFLLANITHWMPLPEPPTIAKCANDKCGKDFTVYRKDKMYCSVRCAKNQAKKFHRDRVRDFKGTTRYMNGEAPNDY